MASLFKKAIKREKCVLGTPGTPQKKAPNQKKNYGNSNSLKILIFITRDKMLAG